MPPELNTARLMMGAGPAPMLQASASWAALGASLQAQATELGANLAALAGSWRGAAADEALASAGPMVTWLQGAALAAQRRGQQAAAQAAAHTKALASTPSLPEIAANHVTRAVLVATNFLGINTVPIGMNETDYFVRMWNQAAAAMDAYQAETMVNTTFEPLPPRPPVLMPGVRETVAAATVGRVSELAAQSAVGDRLTALGVRATSNTLTAMASDVPSAVPKGGADLLTMLSQASQLGTPLLQQLTQLLQQASGSGLGGDGPPPLGLTGASALSNHPLAGGSGPTKGAGLLRGGELPGIGGAPVRTPLLANLIGGPAVGAAAAGAAGAASAAMGVAGVAAGGSGYGAAPVGMAGHGAAAGSRTSTAAPVALSWEPREDDEADSDQDFDDDW